LSSRKSTRSALLECSIKQRKKNTFSTCWALDWAAEKAHIQHTLSDHSSSEKAHIQHELSA